MDTMLKRYYPDAVKRGEIRASIARYQNKEGCFTRLDAQCEERDIWQDSYLTSVAPWDWWKEVAQHAEPDLCALSRRVLQAGV